MNIEIIDSSEGQMVKANVDFADYKGICQIELVHAYDWYDQVEIIEVSCAIKGGMFETKPFKKLEAGLYLLSLITIENGIEIIGNKPKKGFDIQKAFWVGNKNALEDAYLRKLYLELVQHREVVFSENKGNIRTGTTLFDCYVFVKNLNAYSIIEYGDVAVIPFNKYRHLSEAKMIDSFFSSEKVIFDYSSTLNDGFGAVIYIKNFWDCENGDYAKKYALEKASILCNLFSISNHDNCQIIATVTKKVKDDTYSIKVNEAIYQGNLLRLADQGFYLRALYQYISNNESSLRTYIKLFNEAVAEESIWASYFKLWVLLEVMAEANDIKGKTMIAWDGSVIFDKEGKEKIIETSLDLIIELFRMNYSNQYARDFIKVLSISNVRDFLSVCYQRRCCFAHNGGCNTNNAALCNQVKEPCRRCKANLVPEKGKFDDPVWSTLENMTRELVYKEFEKSVGTVPKETEYIDRLVVKGMSCNEIGT